MHTLSVNSYGWVDQSQQILSPNFDARPTQCAIDMIVIHNISLPPRQYGGNGITQLFTNQLDPNEHPYYTQIYTRQVSAHFLIRRDGALLQFVSCYARAWHAGSSQWQNRERCNDFSVGIELEGSDDDAFEPAQYEMLNLLIALLKQHFPIQHIVGHSDIAPGRKTDPGPHFDWQQIKKNESI